MGRRNKVSAIVLVSTFRDVPHGCESVSTETRTLPAKSGTLVMDPASRSETHGSNDSSGQERANYRLAPWPSKREVSSCSAETPVVNL